MEEYILNEELEERKKKQTFLREEVIEKQYDALKFTDFISSERKDGENIDNWRMDELETIVVLYKKQCDQKHKEDILKFELEAIELNDSEEDIYVKRIKTAKKKETIFSNCNSYIMIESIEVQDGGLFSGKSLSFVLNVPELELKVVRVESEFKWLVSMLEKEFPFVPLPPLISIYDKNYQKDTLKLIKEFFEKFLNEIVRHPILKHSLVLEIFFTSETKKLMDKRKKEIKKFFNSHILIDKNLTKKINDSLIGKEPLSIYPSFKGSKELKISSLLKKFYVCADGQYQSYEILFDRLEKVQKEFNKQILKLIDLNSKFKDIFFELKNTSMKFNNTKPMRNRFNMMEDTLFGSISNYFNQFDKILKKQNEIFTNNIGNYSKYMKEYLANVRKIVDQRNFFSNEYYKAKIFLNEKKNKKIVQDISYWELDENLCNTVGIDPDFVKGDPSIARKFMYSDETKKIRKYGDIFAMFNYTIFKELIYFDEYFLKSLLANFKIFSDKNIENITKNHLLFAEMLSDLGDIRNLIQVS